MLGDAPATILRRLTDGDAWDYAVTGTLGAHAGQGASLEGRIEVRITRLDLPSRGTCRAIAFSQDLVTRGPDGEHPFPAPNLTFWFEQDTDTGDVRIFADTMTPDSSPRIAARPQLFYPGTWSAETAFDNTLQFPGTAVRNTLTITGTERVVTPFSARMAWVGPITSSSPESGLIEGTDWWTPELGAPIRFETSSRLPNGLIMALRASLAWSNVAA